MKTVESSAVFQPKQWAEKEAGKTIENRTKPELVPNQASKSNIVRGALKQQGRPFATTACGPWRWGWVSSGKKAVGRPKGSSLKGKKVAPKYRNPKNRSETWAGRGATPRWMAAAIKTGKKKEDFLIHKGQ